MRKLIMFSWACLIAAFLLTLWTWQHLPALETYPVHWNGDGMPDRYGSKSEVLFNLLMMPITSAFIFLTFYFVPKIEPVRASIEPNSRPYILFWAVMMVLFLGVQYFIASSYFGLQTDANTSTQQVPVRFLTAGLSVFYIFLGNLMGKLRRNFLFGIKTPWTLSSDLSWDKTHRIAGRMMVASGLIGLVFSFTLPTAAALLSVVGLILAATLFALVYSFFVWKSDPNKRT